MQAAIEAPRFLIGRDPADASNAARKIEDRFPRAMLADLTRAATSSRRSAARAK